MSSTGEGIEPNEGQPRVPRFTTEDFIEAGMAREADIIAEYMQPGIDTLLAQEVALSHEVTDLEGTSLDQLQAMQQRVDDLTWVASEETGAKRRHIFFQLLIVAGDLARIEDRRDHRESYDDEQLLDGVADLLTFSLQLANLSERSLLDLYKSRTQGRLSLLSEPQS